MISLTYLVSYENWLPSLLSRILFSRNKDKVIHCKKRDDILSAILWLQHESKYFIIHFQHWMIVGFVGVKYSCARNISHPCIIMNMDLWCSFNFLAIFRTCSRGLWCFYSKTFRFFMLLQVIYYYPGCLFTDLFSIKSWDDSHSCLALWP